MTGGEYQAQKIVADVIVECRIEIVHDGLLPTVEIATDLFVLALDQRLAAEPVDRPVLRGCHEPRTGVVGDACLGPVLQRRDKCVLRQLLGKTDIAHDSREPGNDPGRLDSPDRVDRAMCIGSRHRYRSDHPRLPCASRPASRLWPQVLER